MHQANPFYFYLGSNLLKKIIFIFFIICTSKLSAYHSIKISYVGVCTIDKLNKPNPLRVVFKKKNNTTKKIVASVLAFPLPFGVIGLHRIYLGTKPYVPLVYIGTVGGAFGILLFIDFCVILLDKDIEHYKSNPHLCMWIANPNKKTETNTYD